MSSQPNEILIFGNIYPMTQLIQFSYVFAIIVVVDILSDFVEVKGYNFHCCESIWDSKGVSISL